MLETFKNQRKSYFFFADSVGNVDADAEADVLDDTVVVAVNVRDTGSGAVVDGDAFASGDGDPGFDVGEAVDASD